MADALLKTEWKTVPLNDVCLKIQDGAHNSPKEQFSIGGPGRYLYITSKNIRNNFIDLSNVSYVGQDFHDQIYPRCTPEIGDVLLTKDGANTGNVTLNTIAEPFSLLSSVALIKTNAPLLMPEFLAYYLQSPQGLAQITGQMTGTAIKRIILRDLKKADIPLPPRLEQQRIVGLLDEIFEGITRALSNSETALRHTRKMSSSYFDASLNGRESWKLLPIDKCFKVRSGDFLSAKQMDATGSVPVYGGNGVAGHHSSANLDGDNVIIGRVGEKCGNVRNVRGRLWLTDNALYVSEFLQPFDPEFLAIRLEAENLRQTANQTAQPVISYSTIKKIILSFPATISEQKLVVESLNTLSASVEALQSSIKAKIAAQKELKQSVLRNAFSGNL